MWANTVMLISKFLNELQFIVFLNPISMCHFHPFSIAMLSSQRVMWLLFFELLWHSVKPGPGYRCFAAGRFVLLQRCKVQCEVLAAFRRFGAWDLGCYQQQKCIRKYRKIIMKIIKIRLFSMGSWDWTPGQQKPQSGFGVRHPFFFHSLQWLDLACYAAMRK